MTFVASCGRWRRDGSLVRSYSESVSDKLARSVLAALRDFCVLEGGAKKRLAPVQVPAEVVGYVTYAPT